MRRRGGEKSGDANKLRLANPESSVRLDPDALGYQMMLFGHLMLQAPDKRVLRRKLN